MREPQDSREDLGIGRSKVQNDSRKPQVNRKNTRTFVWLHLLGDPVSALAERTSQRISCCRIMLALSEMYRERSCLPAAGCCEDTACTIRGAHTPSPADWRSPREPADKSRDHPGPTPTMCLKYNLQETAGTRDCVSRQREAAMSPSHHTFLIDCDSGVCICLTGAPRPLGKVTSASPQTIMAPSSRRLLRTCLTSCVKEKSPETLADDRCQDDGASLITDKSCVKQKTSVGPLPKTAPWRGPAGQKAGCRSLQDPLKRWIRRLASCVCTE